MSKNNLYIISLLLINFNLIAAETNSANLEIEVSRKNKVVDNSVTSNQVSSSINDDLNTSKINKISNNYVISDKNSTMIEKEVETRINFLSNEISKLSKEKAIQDEKVQTLENSMIEVNKYIKYLGTEVNKNREKLNITSRQVEKIILENSTVSNEFPKIKEELNSENSIKIERVNDNSENIKKKLILSLKDNEKYMITNTAVNIRNSLNKLNFLIPKNTLIITEKNKTKIDIDKKLLVKYKILSYFNKDKEEWNDLDNENYIYYKYANDLK